MTDKDLISGAWMAGDLPAPATAAPVPLLRQAATLLEHLLVGPLWEAHGELPGKLRAMAKFDLAQERVAFEAEARTRGWDLTIRHTRAGIYQDDTVQVAWSIWRARAQLEK